MAHRSSAEGASIEAGFGEGVSPSQLVWDWGGGLALLRKMFNFLAQNSAFWRLF